MFLVFYFYFGLGGLKFSKWGGDEFWVWSFVLFGKVRSGESRKERNMWEDWRDLSGKENLFLFLSVCLSMIGRGNSTALHYVHCDCLNNYSHFDLLQEKTKQKNKQTDICNILPCYFMNFFFFFLWDYFMDFSLWTKITQCVSMLIYYFMNFLVCEIWATLRRPAKLVYLTQM